MPERPPVPEEVYREAAAVYTGTAHWAADIQKATTDAYVAETHFRAAVETAYRAGHAAGQAEGWDEAPDGW
jgi:hypothetical protein